MRPDVFCFPSKACLLVMNYPTYYLVSFILIVLLVAALILFRNRQKLFLQKMELNKFYQAVESAYDHIIITSNQGIVLYANKAVERVTGFKIKEVIGQKAGKLWGGLMPKEFYVKMWKRILVDKKVFAGEVTNHRKNGKEYIAMSSISPVLDEQKNVLFFVGIERDITKEKELEQTKSDFISMASHQLKTPLTIIKGYISMLTEGTFGVLEPTQQEVLEKVYESNERQINLVQDFLNVSRIEAGRMVYNLFPENLGNLAASVVNELAGMAKKKGLTLSLVNADKIPSIEMDKEKLRQVMTNLIENSIKYTPAGKIEVATAVIGKNIRFTVSDTGMGIKPDEMMALFSKYSRGSDSSEKTKTIKGTGLGLYVGKMIVEAQGGRIWAESAGENKGSLFAFELPIKALPLSSPAVARAKGKGI